MQIPDEKEQDRLMMLGFDLWFLRYKTPKRDNWYQTTDLIRQHLVEHGAKISYSKGGLHIIFPWGYKVYGDMHRGID